MKKKKGFKKDHKITDLKKRSKRGFQVNFGKKRLQKGYFGVNCKQRSNLIKLDHQSIGILHVTQSSK